MAHVHERAARSAQDRGLAKRLYESVVAEPVTLGLDDRYLCGHYLAYLLGGSRRKGFLLRRPLDPLNADRARLLLGMTSIVHSGPSDQAIADAGVRPTDATRNRWGQANLTSNHISATTANV